MGKEPPWEFDWDASNLSHLARHGISREEFEQAMTHDPLFLDFDDRAGEERWYVLGATHRLRVLFLVFTFRGERLRPITGWNAEKRMREAYYQSKKE